MASSDMGIMTRDFQKQYPTINIELMKNNPKEYDMSIIVAYTIEKDKGYIVKKMGRTHKKGTKFTYKICESEEEIKKYEEKLNELLKDYYEKYSSN